MKSTKLALTALFLITLSGQILAQGSIDRSPWEMNLGGSYSQLGFTLPSHGYPGDLSGSEYDESTGAYANASIPATTDSNWGPAPDLDIIGFGGSNSSIIPLYINGEPTCQTVVDYTYFQTFVNVPSGTNVTEFTIEFSTIDDGGRVTVFNSAYPNGIVISGSYVTLANGGTADLAQYIVNGENRIVVTQVDDCPTGNNLKSAIVVLNGETVELCQGTEQTFTILGGDADNVYVGDVNNDGVIIQANIVPDGTFDSYTEVSTDGGQTWGPAYLTGWHPWGYVTGTNSWLSPYQSKYAGVGTGANPTEYDFRIRFYVPEDFSDPSMVLTVKVDNAALIWINGTSLTASPVTGQVGNFNIPDAVVETALFPGINEIRLRLLDYGGIVGINYRIDVTMTSCEDLTNAIKEVSFNPEANAGGDQTLDCVIESADVTLDGSGSDDADGDALTYSWTLDGSEVSTSASFTTSLGGGTYTYTLTVDDGNGGTDSDDVTITVILDETAPDLTVPDPVTVSANADGGFDVYINDIGEAIATDACDANVVITNSTQGVILPLGVHTVTWTATDAAGNTTTGDQVVTVVPMPGRN